MCNTVTLIIVDINVILPDISSKGMYSMWEYVLYLIYTNAVHTLMLQDCLV